MGYCNLVDNKMNGKNPDYRNPPLIFRCPDCGWQSQPWRLKSLPTPFECKRCEGICIAEEMKDELG